MWKRNGTPDSCGAVVVAPAGVGKSRLLREVGAQAHRSGLRTASVIATRAAATTPYGAMVRLLSGAAEHTSVMSWYRAITAAIRAEDNRRLVLLVDDAQLLDPGSADVLLHLAMDGAAVPIVTVREGEPVPDSVTALWKDAGAVRLDLPPFSRADMLHMLSEVFGDELSPRTAELLASKADGNVLHARELVAAAVETGSLSRIDGLWQWDEQLVLAPRLIDAVEERLAGLTTDDREALALVALAEPLPWATAERLADPYSLSRLERTRLVLAEDETLRLHHPLYGETLLSQLGVATRRRLLRRLADALEATSGAEHPDVLVRLASWRLESGSEVSTDLLINAARAANTAFDHVRAEVLARAAGGGNRAEPGGPGSRTAEAGPDPHAAQELAAALTGLTRHAEAEEVLVQQESVVLAGDDIELWLAHLNTRYRVLHHGLAVPPGTVEAVLDSAVPAAARLPEPDRHRVDVLQLGMRANAGLDTGLLGEVIAAGRSLLDDPRCSDDSRLLALETTGEALAYLGRHQQAASIQAELGEFGATVGSETATAEAALHRLLCLSLDGRVAEATPIAAGFYQSLMHGPDSLSRGLAALTYGKCLLQQGKPQSARRILIDAVTTFRANRIGGSLAWALVLLSQAAATSGDLEAARHWLAEAEAHPVRRRITRIEPDLAAARAWVAALGGDTGAALAAINDGVAGLGEMWLPQAALVHLGVRLGGPAREAHRALTTLSAHIDHGANATDPTSTADLPQLLADHAAAADDPVRLEMITDRFAERGLVLCAAETATQAARLHQRAGSPAGATRAAARAERLRTECEDAATPLLADVSAVLPDLTRRERQIAQLAAAGLSNAEIAERLVLSVRTVESHLYLAFGKLGVERRSELVTVLGPQRSPYGKNQ